MVDDGSEIALTFGGRIDIILRIPLLNSLRAILGHPQPARHTTFWVFSGTSLSRERKSSMNTRLKGGLAGSVHSNMPGDDRGVIEDFTNEMNEFAA